MSKVYKMDLAGRELSVEIGKVAELANGECIVRYGDTVVLVTATASEKPRAGIDFFPLSIDYEEKMYSVGKIPGGFNKREGRPSEKAILTARVIDRPIRPLFPKDYRNDVSINAMVLCVEQDNQPEICAMLGSSIALSISDIPFYGPTASVSVGMIDGEYIINPTVEQREKSQMALTVSSTKDKVMMIEAGANEVTDEEMYNAIMFGHQQNVEICKFIDKIVEENGKPKHSYEEHVVDHDLYEAIKAHITDARIEETVFTDLKQVRDERISEITAEIFDLLFEKFGNDDEEQFQADIDEAIYKYEKETVRRMILRNHKRPDGRQLNEIRPLSAEVDILPRTHGSALFKRGQTQVLTVTTIGSIAEAQKIDGLDANETTKRYMHHYNFPGFSVGEAKPSRSPGRREIGHGALAERALRPVIPSEEEFPYSLRLVSEVLSSNGSTSQASVCGSTLSLMAAGVPIKRPVAGISCGLVTSDTDDDFILLTDIQGLEDFFGDMDFKVTGTTEGITAIQMDIKIHGLTRPIVEEAIRRTREARLFIMDTCMKPAIAEPRKTVGEFAPKIIQTTIDPAKIGEVVGQRGKVINAIIEECGVKIDITDDGFVSVCGVDQAGMDKAMKYIRTIVDEFEEGKIYEGKVVSIKEFGAFVEFAPGKEGMVHISKISKERINMVEDVLTLGDVVKCKCMGKDKMGRISFSIKDAE